MSEYAKKEVLIEKILQMAEDYEKNGGLMNMAFATATKGVVGFLKDKDCGIFEEAKPVVHAHWKQNWAGLLFCSNCADDAKAYMYRKKYCPDCGAQMDELVSKTDDLNSSVVVEENATTTNNTQKVSADDE